MDLHLHLALHLVIILTNTLTIVIRGFQVAPTILISIIVPALLLDMA